MPQRQNGGTAFSPYRTARSASKLRSTILATTAIGLDCSVALGSAPASAADRPASGIQPRRPADPGGELLRMSRSG